MFSVSTYFSRTTTAPINVDQKKPVDADQKPSTEQKSEGTSATELTVVGVASVSASFAGQYIGRGFAVRVGSNYIYNSVFAKTLASTPWYIPTAIAKWTTAPAAANASVGAMTNTLAWIGGSSGAAAGLLSITLVVGAFKVVIYLYNKSVEKPAKEAEKPAEAAKEPEKLVEFNILPNEDGKTFDTTIVAAKK